MKRQEDIGYLNEFHPDYAGFVFAGTKRRITPEAAAALAEKLDSGIGKVGVFADEEPETVCRAVRLAGLDIVQLHGGEAAEYIEALRRLLPGMEIWKAVRVRDRETVLRALTLPADRFLLDAFSPTEAGGTGRVADLGVIRSCRIEVPYFLAGGLNAGNLATIVREMRPYGVDVSSGIETGGAKDRRKIETVMRILRGESGEVGSN
ncbi:phosphoribosylanthranilate isomerase [Caproicibacter sp. BJN0012]|uniref:phosphoribosylanthranilate isomerase n=1 Tax=Caproicibacter sp. BJN0012 TaxID=3110227 RepID=UPI002E1484D3